MVHRQCQQTMYCMDRVTESLNYTLSQYNNNYYTGKSLLERVAEGIYTANTAIWLWREFGKHKWQ